MLTAVLERQGPLGRFTEPFLAFLRPLQIPPLACNGAQPQEKGKVEKGAIHDIRPNFWPLRTCRDLTDLQAQANQWRAQVAHVRLHPSTGQPPIQRFDPKARRALPTLCPDGRETAQAKGPTDCAMRFAGTPYTVPPWRIGQSGTVKADQPHLTCSCKDKAVATHRRCGPRQPRLALPQHREAAPTHHWRPWSSPEVAAWLSLGKTAKRYLERWAAPNEPLQKPVKKLLALKDDDGAQALVEAMQRATLHQA